MTMDFPATDEMVANLALQCRVQVM